MNPDCNLLNAQQAPSAAESIVWCTACQAGFCSGSHYSAGVRVTPWARHPARGYIEKFVVYAHQDREQLAPPAVRPESEMDAQPLVLVHIDSESGDLDSEGHLTPTEARMLALALIAQADLIEGRNQ